MKKKKMGLGDVTNGIGAKVQKLGKICAHQEMVNCYKFYEKKKNFYIFDILSGILSGIHVIDFYEVETLIWEWYEEAHIPEWLNL